MKKLYLSIVAILGIGLLTLLPLANRSVRVVLNEAEARVNEEPERVLELLDSIAPLQMKWSRSLQARFALLYTRAQDKSLIDVDDDSLIIRAVDYYRSHGDHRTRAMAYYYYGVIRHNAGDIDGAMEALVKAQLEVEECDDSYLQGLIYSELGNAYYEQYTFIEASEMYKLAIGKFRNCNLHENEFIAQYCCGLSLFLANNYSESYEYLSSSLEYAVKTNSVETVLNIGMALTYMDVKQCCDPKDIEILKQRLFKHYLCYTNNVIPITHYPLVSNIYAKEHKLDSARYFILEFLKSDVKIESQNIGIWALLSSIECESNHYQQAYNYEKIFSYYNDSINQFIRNSEVRALDRKYKNKELKNSYKKLQIKHRYERLVILLLFSFLGIAMWLAYRYFQRKRSKEREMFDISIGEFRRHYEELEKGYIELKDSNNANEKHSQALLSLLEKRVKDMKQISEWATLYEKSPDVFYQKIKEYFVLSDSKNKELVREVLTFADLYCFEIIDYLRSICPALSSRELCYCGLACLGFTPESIRILFNHTNVSSIYTIRNKIRDKLALKKSSFNLEKHIQDLLNEAKVRQENKGRN